MIKTLKLSKLDPILVQIWSKVDDHRQYTIDEENILKLQDIIKETLVFDTHTHLAQNSIKSMETQPYLFHVAISSTKFMMYSRCNIG